VWFCVGLRHWNRIVFQTNECFNRTLQTGTVAAHETPEPLALCATIFQAPNGGVSGLVQ
jgi:hypothetical protein